MNGRARQTETSSAPASPVATRRVGQVKTPETDEDRLGARRLWQQSRGADRRDVWSEMAGAVARLLNESQSPEPMPATMPAPSVLPVASAVPAQAVVPAEKVPTEDSSAAPAAGRGNDAAGDTVSSGDVAQVSGTQTDRQLLADASKPVVQNAPGPAPSRTIGDPNEAGDVAGVTRLSRTAAPSAPVQHKGPPPPTRSLMAIALDFESESAPTRAAAVAELAQQTGPDAWTVMLRAQLSRYPDVRTGAEGAFRAWAKQPGFRQFLQQQADAPHAMTSDLAVILLQSLGEEGPVDPENYRNVIRQRLDLAQVWVNGLANDFEEARQRLVEDFTQPPLTSPRGVMFGPSTLLLEIEALNNALTDAKPEALAPIGVRSSLLLERLSLVRTMVAGLKEQSGKLKDPGEMKDFLDTRIATLLSATAQMTSETDDAATQQIAVEIARWPQDLAVMLAGQVHRQFANARKQIADAIPEKPLPSFEQAWSKYRKEVLEPILVEVDGLVQQAASIEAGAAVDADRAFDDLRDLGPMIEDLGGRVQAAMAAVDMEATYKDLALTDEAAKDVFEATEWDIKQYFAAFAQISADRSLTPEERQQLFEQLAQSERLKEIEEEIKQWHEIQAGELRFAMLLAEVAIVVISIYTAGIAGGIVRGLLGRGVTLAGRIAIGSAVVGAEATAFTVTSRLLHVPLGGKFYDEKFWGELGQNAVLFGVLKGAGTVYEKLVAPKLPESLVGAGKATLTFSMFQAWTVGLHRWETGEWIGLGDARFWKMAAQNALFLGAIHVGMGITQPLMAPVSERVMALAIERHNARCAALGESIDAWKQGKELDSNGALGIARRARALYLERLDILRSIHDANPKEFTREELEQAEKVLRAQAAAAEETMFQGRARMAPHDTDPNTFFYEGDPEAIRDHYKSKGYEVVEFDTATGRMRLKDPAGNVLDFLRSKFGTTGAARRPTAAEAAAIYETIRKAHGDTAAIAKNTGVPEALLDIIKQHVFFAKHMVFDPAEGKQVRRTFDPDEDIARLWTAATSGKLEGEDLAAFRRLMAHEYVEAMLVRSGIPYQHPDAWVKEADGTWTYRPGPEHFGAHDLAPRADVLGQAFGHYEALKIPLKNVTKLPLRAWMDIPPEDLIYVDDPKLSTALSQIAKTLGSDVARKLVALSARGGADPSLAGTLERLTKLPYAEAIKQAEELIARLGAKAAVPPTPERGAPFKRGGTAQLYEMKGQPDLLVKPAGGRLSREAQAMLDLESLGIPTPYVTRQMVEGTQSIILEKIDGEGSKDIIGRVSDLRPLREAKHTEIVTEKTIEDLHRIYDVLVRNKVNIGDFQFIVRSSDGAVFVNDPTGLTFDSYPSSKVKMIIERFEAILKRKKAGSH